MNYELYVGLWANRERTLIRRALSVSIGIGLCFGNGSDNIFDALSESNNEKDIIKSKYESSAKEREQLISQARSIKYNGSNS